MCVDWKLFSCFCKMKIRKGGLNDGDVVVVERGMKYGKGSLRQTLRAFDDIENHNRKFVIHCMTKLRKY